MFASYSGICVTYLCFDLLTWLIWIILFLFYESFIHYYTNPKSFRPISLTSFFIKTLERLVDPHVREGFLLSRSLHLRQFSCQAGKSTGTVLHHVIPRVEAELASESSVMTFTSMYNVLETHDTKSSVMVWISALLWNRQVSADLSSNMLELLELPTVYKIGAITLSIEENGQSSKWSE